MKTFLTAVKHAEKSKPVPTPGVGSRGKKSYCLFMFMIFRHIFIFLQRYFTTQELYHHLNCLRLFIFFKHTQMLTVTLASSCMWFSRWSMTNLPKVFPCYVNSLMFFHCLVYLSSFVVCVNITGTILYKCW